MSVWSYRDEAVRHVWEFVDLGFYREEDRKELHSIILANPEPVDSLIAGHQHLVLELVRATPSRRESMLRRMAGANRANQMALILGAWQHCRKAVFAYEWLSHNEMRFTPGRPYREETANQGLLFDELKKRRLSKWPPQWGRSPYPGEKSRSPNSAPDFNSQMDNYDPTTGMY